MLTKRVVWYLSMLASTMSAMTIDDGGAVRAWSDSESSVFSGSSEMMRTVWSAQPTACVRGSARESGEGATDEVERLEEEGR